MDSTILVEGLITYLCFLPLVTLHEVAHAWVAWKCGDDTARLQGRVSLNPVVHMELLGTVILPLLGVFLSSADSKLAGFIIGWGKPVPVNIYNLRRPRLDDTLVALAGPAMNIVLAIVIVLLGKLGGLASSQVAVETAQRMAVLSLFLCYFNLLPIPPLDGSHVVKNLIGMSYEAYWRLAQYGFLMIILVIQFRALWSVLEAATMNSYKVIVQFVGL
jgi:Zn-dependent protease